MRVELLLGDSSQRWFSDGLMADLKNSLNDTNSEHVLRLKWKLCSAISGPLGPDFSFEMHRENPRWQVPHHRRGRWAFWSTQFRVQGDAIAATVLIGCPGSTHPKTLLSKLRWEHRQLVSQVQTTLFEFAAE